MITKFKIYESLDEPELGDYVIIKTKLLKHKSVIEVIGEIYALNRDQNIFYVEFKMPDNNVFQDSFWRYEIIHWSKNREELETILDEKKYNV